MVVAPYWAARVMISTTRQFLVLDSGRHSVTRTRSPSLQALASSWACSLVERRRYLPYSACLTWRSTSTVTVLSILLLTTRPSTVLTAGVVLAFSLICSALLLGGQQHVHARDLAAHTADVVGLGQLPRRLLHAERELLLAQIEQVGLEVGGRLLAQFLEFHVSAPS